MNTIMFSIIFMLFGFMDSSTINTNAEHPNSISISAEVEMVLSESATTEEGAWVYCQCARYNHAILRWIGFGNRDCRASNIGSICGGGVNYTCSQNNSSCGGINPDPEVNE